MLFDSISAVSDCDFYSQVFPSYSSARRPLCKNSALARIKEKRAELKAIAVNCELVS